MSFHLTTDEDIIKAITGTSESRERVLRYIFHQSDWKVSVVSFVVLNAGTEEDGEDVFQETLILFDQNLRLNRFEGKSGLKTYFLSIAKRRWWKLFNQRRIQSTIPASYEFETGADQEVEMINEEQKHYLSQALGQIGSRCKQILQLYQLDYSMEEIAKAVSLSSATMAKKEAYRCRMRLREFLENNSGWIELIK